MLNIEAIKSMLLEAGWFPSIVLLGAWGFIPILVIVLLYNLFLNIIIKISNYKKE